MAAVLCRPCACLAVSCLTSYRSSLASSALITRPPCCSSHMPITVLGVFHLLLTLPGLYILLRFKWLAPSHPPGFLHMSTSGRLRLLWVLYLKLHAQLALALFVLFPAFSPKYSLSSVSFTVVCPVSWPLHESVIRMFMMAGHSLGYVLVNSWHLEQCLACNKCSIHKYPMNE